MELTKNDLKKCAKEARKLAFECLEGTNPTLTPASFNGCALNVVVKRAGIVDAASNGARVLDDILMEEEKAFCLSMVSNGLLYSGIEGIVFPLLWAADVFEAQSK